ncbi:MAG: hypothetical protein MPJ24_04870 [Pirellulaceae bacterium]|nr:hypothetical protein [Pirellulaceae bacterium]
MAKCDEGYLCVICTKEVAGMTNSDLYLRYLLGQVDVETLHAQPERHIRCNPVLAQYIVEETFSPVVVEGDFDKRTLDPSFVSQQEELVTRAWKRLKTLPKSNLSIQEYPLPEFRNK